MSKLTLSVKKPRSERLEEGLEICKKTAALLKEKFPDQIMKITDNTIIEFSVKNRHLISDGWKMRSINSIAFYDQRNNVIVIKQKMLLEREGYMDEKYYSSKPKIHQLNIGWTYGNFALVELMCHELAHHKTNDNWDTHCEKFRIKYQQFLKFMVNKIISGEFYNKKGVF